MRMSPGGEQLERSTQRCLVRNFRRIRLQDGRGR